MARRCPHGKRIKTFASCEVCNREINVLALARLTSRAPRMLSLTVAVECEKDDRERTGITSLTLNKVAS